MGLRIVVGIVALIAGCHDDFLGPTAADTPVEGEGWCVVRAVFDDDCVGCHSASGRLGDLDLESDPYGAVVGVAAALDPTLTLVVSGDPEASFLLRKLRGDLAAGEGGGMPPGAPLSPATIDAVAQWIADGAPDTCDDVDTDTDVGTYHPAGYDDPADHGREARLQDQVCVTCHGDDLLGRGAASSCDGCHPAGWRTDCTFCHGDPVEGSGSPPVHLSGVDDGAAATFLPHRAHTGATDLHAAYPCAQCHDTPTDVLTLGHLFLGDDTPGRAEVDLASGTSDAGVWNTTTGTCSQLWCHGTGRGDNGAMVHTGAVTTCHDCHPDATSGRDAWGRMSGEHEDHLREGIACWECHGDTTDAGQGIVDVGRHVDGTVDVALRAGVTWTGAACTGSCHGEGHQQEPWR